MRRFFQKNNCVDVCLNSNCQFESSIMCRVINAIEYTAGFSILQFFSIFKKNMN